MRNRFLLFILCATTGLIEGSQSGPDGSFGTVKISLHPHERGVAIAAYQLELIDASGRARLVGLEGGEAPFGEPPYYDPAALQPTSSHSGSERVIVAAYSLESPESTGTVVVATLHYWVEGSAPLSFTTRDVILVDPEGHRRSGDAHLALEGFTR